MKMKLKNLITIAALASVAMAASACGKKKNGSGDGDGDGDGDMGGAGSIDSQLDDLRDEIEELKKLLADAQDDQIPALEAALKDAEDRLAELENCANTGNCEGLNTVQDLTVLTDAYCDWVFGCCTNDEVRATLGNAAQDAEGCKALYADMIQHNNGTPYMPGFDFAIPVTGAGTPMGFGVLAEMLQRGMAALDEDALAACAEEKAGAACGGADPVPPAECGEGEESACADILIGLQDVSEPCRAGTCKEGLECIGAGPAVIDGVCMPYPEENDHCQSDSECSNADGTLYCDEDDGVCKKRPTEDEDCVFEDPTFDLLSPTVQKVPCEAGFFCSAETSTCVAGCTALDANDLCYDSEQCGPTRYCDFTDAAVADMSKVGVCTAKLNTDAESTDADICKSGGIWNDGGTFRCQSRGDEVCDFDLNAGADCKSGSCREADDTCRAACTAQYDCADDETCVSGACYEHVGSNGECLVNEQCPAAQFCDEGTCANKGGAGDSCGDDIECEAGHACVNLECHPYEGLAGGEFCNDWYHCTSQRCDTDNNDCIAASELGDEGDACDMETLDATDINVDPCGPGLFCKRSAPNSTTDFSGTCTTQLSPGQVCDQSLNPAVKQCAGNVVCSSSPATNKLACPVTYSVPDQHESCSVLGVSDIHGTNVAYGNFPEAPKLVEAPAEIVK